MEYEFVQVERRGHVTIVTLNRPEVLNALHAPANYELDRLFNDFAADPDQWVAVITGAGERAFCAGNDLKHQAAVGFLEAPATGMAGITSRFDLTKPVIAAVNGLALGGGFEIALACDVVIAAEHSVFSLPEPRVGLAALGGGLFRLPASVGINRAMAMVLSSERVTAAEAKAIGIVYQVTSPEDLMVTALAMAERICEASPLSVRASKDMMLASLGRDFADAWRLQGERPSIVQMWESEDAKEGPQAFAAKRAPIWKGR